MLSKSRMLLLLGGLLVAGRVQAQAPAWQAAIAAGQVGSGNVAITATTADAAGNVYLAGTFNGTVSFGNTTLSSAGTSGFDEVFIAKWSSASASFAWAQRAGGTDIDRATAIAVSGSSVYVAGVFGSSTAAFGNLSLTNFASAGGGFGFDVFVAKLTDAGASSSFTWVQQAGGAYFDNCGGLAVSGSNVYLAGWFGSPMASFGSLTLQSAGGNDGFVAKLTDAGASSSFAWVLPLGSAGDEQLRAVAVQGASVYVAGSFDGSTLAVGSSRLSNASAGSPDALIAKLTDAGSAGSFAWGQRAGSTGIDYATGLAASGNSVYCTGVFGGASGSFGGTTLLNANAPNYSAFLTKLTDAGASGSIEWALQPDATGLGPTNALAASPGAAYVAGSFGGGATRWLLAKYTDAGSSARLAWTQGPSGAGGATATALAAVGATVYVAGAFSPPVAFGGYSLAAATPAAGGFLATLADAPLATTAAAASAAGYCFPNPAHAATTVWLPASLGPALATLTLQDALGQVVRRQTLRSVGGSAEVPVLDLSPGLYHLRLQYENQALVYRLVVE